MNYRSEIDGLRALAVLAVILFHTGIRTFQAGYVGVDVFFVISGHLITALLLREHATGKIDLRHFYERRIRRILPALFLVVFVCIPLAWFSLFPYAMKVFGQSVMAVAAFSSNFLFWQEHGYFDAVAATKPLQHTWSLAVEEQYYLVFPLLMMLLLRWKRSLVVLALFIMGLASFGWGLWFSRYDAEGAFYLLPSRAFEILAGALCAFVVIDRKKYLWLAQILALVGLGLLVQSMRIFYYWSLFPNLLNLVPIAGTCLILLFAHSQTWVGKFLSLRPLVFIGLISYSAYLWHQPLFAFAGHYSIVPVSQTQMLGLSLLSLLLAWVSWRYVECPFRDARIFSRRAIFISAGLGITLLMAMGFYIDSNEGLSNRLSPEVLKYMLDDPLVFDRGCANTKGDELVGCIRGETHGPVDWALWGDSQSGSVAGYLAQKQSFVQYTKFGCAGVWQPEDNPCARYSRRVVDDIQKRKLKTVVLVTRWPNYPQVISSYADNVRRLLDLGLNVVLVYPMPEMNFNPVEYLAKHLWRTGRQATVKMPYSDYLKQSQLVFHALDSIGANPRLRRVYVDDIFCDAQWCYVERNGQRYYNDAQHPSGLGAQSIVMKIVTP